MDKRQLLLILSIAGQALLAGFMVVVTLLLLLGDVVTLGQFIYRSLVIVLLPPLAGLVVYIAAGRDVMKAANASGLMLMLAIAVFAMNTRQRRSDPVETDIQERQREKEMEEQRGERITAWIPHAEATAADPQTGSGALA